jgi:nicotinamide mononucleotide adenylyltransferase
MGAHLTKHDIKSVVNLIDNWVVDEKFTWDSLCKTANKRLSVNATRQTLYSHKEIQSAFKIKKQMLRSDGAKDLKIPPSLNIAANRIKKLEAENARLKQERDDLLAQFVIWQYNAERKGISRKELSLDLIRT